MEHCRLKTTYLTLPYLHYSTYARCLDYCLLLSLFLPYLLINIIIIIMIIIIIIIILLSIH